jgi:hypothetical protein
VEGLTRSWEVGVRPKESRSLSGLLLSLLVSLASANEAVKSVVLLAAMDELVPVVSGKTANKHRYCA